MMYRVKGTLMPSVALLAALALTGVAQAKFVTVKGEAAIENGDEAQARKQALKDAFRKAVEQVAGVKVQSTTVTEEWEIIKDEIIAKTEGMVTSHKVLSEGAKSGVYEITIKADVADKPVGEAIDQLVALKKNSKIAIMVSESMAGNTDFSARVGERGKTEDIMINLFRERGFPVVDLSGLAGLNLSSGAKSGELTAADAKKVAERADAQYIVMGKVTGRDAGSIMGSGLHSYQLTVSLRMFSVVTQSIIATVTEATTVPSVSPDLGNPAALKHYKKKLNEKVMKTFITRIAKTWTEEEQTGSVRVQLVVKNVPNYKTLKAIIKAVKKFKGVSKATKRGLKSKQAKIDVEMDTNTDALADQLSGARVAGYKVEVQEVDEGRIVVSVGK